MQVFFNWTKIDVLSSVLIALYRPYMHRHLKDQYEDVALKAKAAAASTTSVLNELISMNAIEVGPSMLYEDYHQAVSTIAKS